MATNPFGGFNLVERLERQDLAIEAILKRLSMPPLESFNPKPKVIKPDPVFAKLDATKLPAYEYTPLDVSKSEIRILQLKHNGGDDDGPLLGSLIPVSLEGARRAADMTPTGRARNSFTALSYTWGAPVFDGSIIIDGRVLRITSSLERALKQIRKNKNAQLFRNPAYSNPVMRQRALEQPAYWWVDAVCINQQDVDERNAQVALMRRIYHNAPSVTIWLGDQADDSKLAMGVVEDIQNMPARGPGAAEVQYPVVPDEDKIRKWKALAALFQRPWWERAWIRQEVALSKMPQVHCGDVTVPFASLDNVGKILGQLTPYLVTNRAGDSGPMSKSLWESARYGAPAPLAMLNSEASRGTKFLDLVGLLRHSRDCKATDDRDKVYAVLGLADPQVYGLKADYRLGTTDIYISTARAIIETTKRLQILSAGQNPERANGLPSWVPDLTSPWRAQPFPMRTVYGDADTSFSEDGRILKAKGHICGTVGELCPATVAADASPDQLQSVYTTWQKFLAEANAGFKKNRIYGNQNPTYLDELSDSKSFLDRPWLDFLSLNTITSRDLAYEQLPSGHLQLVPNRLLDFYSTPGGVTDMKHVHALLMPVPLEAEGHRYARLHAALRAFGLGRRLGVVDPGSLALLPGEAKTGDKLVAFDGAAYPYVLRKVEGGAETSADDKWVVVGEAHSYQGAYNSQSTEFFSIV
ncbi:hypothetical protein MAPG_00204 [Magnaporthiopsis poae ATCC 64411]|uniref:Heterokaryon incompatibility domain-containing protein n=1 Tax=Magnaporthiopsis poae (strain ATCC 64411 / 73-15) TaxID=644358 RepID=A0A0C4DKD6_MAGP6|nr:hypothetical protein MAPG_00204 [Magnaporthiopsis poae ATCC 64411]